MSEKQGMLVAFEGCDRAGKSTQIDLLIKHLNKKNIKCIKLAFPYYNSPYGKLIKEKLENGGDAIEMNLLFIANRYELQNRIYNYLNAGIHVFCDRYKSSGLAYGIASGLNRFWLENCDDINMDPDLTIYLDIDPEIASKRNDFGNGGIYERVEFQKSVRKEYLKLIDHDNWIVIENKDNNDYIFVLLSILKQLKDKKYIK